jgi:hypothetical protein
MNTFAFRYVIAAAAAALAGCGVTPAHALPAARATTYAVAADPNLPHLARASEAAGQRGKPQVYPAAFVASASGGKVQGLAVFSSSGGRLLRWLVRGEKLPVPVAVSPHGTWVYFYYPAAPSRQCPSNGFVEPLLWRVRVAGGRPQRTDIHTTDLAFSPDGRMTAHTSTRKCGQTLVIVVHNQRTGATRTIIAARNDLSGNGPIFFAQLSWAPDDVHLAVAMAPAAAINSLIVINVRRATDITGVQSIPPCAAARSAQVGCLDPGFDRYGGLTFLKWLEKPGSSQEWAVRWRSGHATRIFRLSRATSFDADIAVDHAGNAILLEGYGPLGLWRWSGGSLRLLRGPGSRPSVYSALWLSR